jgi:hypothetical protein
VCDDLIRRLAQDAGSGDRELAHDRIELALVTDGAAEPTVLLKIARRMRHHPEDVGIAILVEDFAGAVGCLGRVAVVDAGHDFPEVFP